MIYGLIAALYFMVGGFAIAFLRTDSDNVRFVLLAWPAVLFGALGALVARLIEVALDRD